MSLTPRMADSTRPQLIPETFRVNPNGVLAYADGAYQWPQPEVDSFPRHVSIATRPLHIDPQAWRARELDVERFDATPADMPPFYAKRIAEHGDTAQVICYCDRSTVRQVQLAMLAQLGPHAASDLLWHIATLDGVKWTPRDLAAQINRLWGAQISAERIWAIQWLPMGTYDESAVWGDPRWATSP